MSSMSSMYAFTEVPVPAAHRLKILNQYGAEGWSCVCILRDHGGQDVALLQMEIKPPHKEE